MSSIGRVGQAAAKSAKNIRLTARRKETTMASYTVCTSDDAPDVLGDYPGEMRMFTQRLEAEQVAFTYRRMPQHTGGKGSYGHRHKTQEEIYFVISGQLEFKLGDDVIELGPRTAVCVPPEVVRSVWNERPEDAELVIVSKRVEDPRADAEAVEGFWPE
jgi:mannose-6-phosphate isomerase-like protein (cupin superfamily)